MKKRKKAPRSAADPRSNNRPYYINPNCPDCGTPLVLEDLLTNPDTPADEIWYDEWVCPKCYGEMESGEWGLVYVDWPEGEWEARSSRR